MHVGEAVEQAVEQAGEAALDRALVGAARALAVDHDVALAPARDEALDHLGRVLEVGVHDHDGAPARVVEAGRDRHLLAEIAAERHRADPRLRGVAGANRRKRIVLAAVIDEHDLPGRGDPLEDRHQPIAEGLDVGAFVEDRDDDAEFGCGQAHALISLAGAA